MKDGRASIAEGIGTFFLVFVGCGAIMVDALAGGLGPVGVSLAFGFVLTVLVYALGHLSGAHFNPAITLAFAITGHTPWRRVPAYLAAQLAGATAAALVLRLTIGNVASLGATTTTVNIPSALAVEALATFLLALVIIAVATDPRAPRAAAGLAIGLTVGAAALAFGPLTGASLNPARSIGPALVSGTIADLWVYLVGPIVGAVAAMASYELLRGPSVPAADAEARL